jgi:hypothetical protein
VREGHWPQRQQEIGPIPDCGREPVLAPNGKCHFLPPFSLAGTEPASERLARFLLAARVQYDQLHGCTHTPQDCFSLARQVACPIRTLVTRDGTKDLHSRPANALKEGVSNLHERAARSADR